MAKGGDKSRIPLCKGEITSQAAGDVGFWRPFDGKSVLMEGL